MTLGIYLYIIIRMESTSSPLSVAPRTVSRETRHFRTEELGMDVTYGWIVQAERFKGIFGEKGDTRWKINTLST